MSEQCAECGNTYRSQLAWKAEIEQIYLEQLPYNERESFLDALSDSVQAVCDEFGLVIA